MTQYNSISVKKRLLCALLALAFFLCLLLGRLFYIQILTGKALTKRATKQWMRDIPLSALRGTIYDRNGAVLASSYTTYDLYVRPNSIKNKEEVSAELSKILNIDYTQTYEKVSSRQSEVKIYKQMSHQTAAEIKKKNFVGVYLSENSTREYAYNDLLCQVLGFCNADGDGQNGIEAYYNKYLKGVGGTLISQTDNAGREINGSSATYIPSIPGMNIKLTIDINIQKLAEKAVQNITNEQATKKATVVVMDPNTGEILAMAMTPSFDLNNVPRDDISALMAAARNSAIQDSYEPGSTFKIITGAIAMQLGLASENSWFYCPGYRIINGVKINCARRSGHGSQSLEQGFMNSCNCVFMDLVSKIGLTRFYQELNKYCIGKAPAIDFPSPATGILMNKASVTQSDLARMGFGQTIAVSPLQLIAAVCGVLNDGTYMKPHFVKSIGAKTGEIVFLQNPTKYSQVVSPSVSSSIRKMLQSVVDKGGGKKAQIEGYKIGGKTGTAQKYENGTIAQGKYVASFVGVLPADKPEYVVLVVADEPKGSFYGATAAAPYAKQVMEGIIKYKNMAQENQQQTKRYITMPNLLGLTETQARSLLASLELYYLFEGEGGEVVSQVPSAGAQIEVGDVVLARFNQRERQ